MSANVKQLGELLQASRGTKAEPALAELAVEVGRCLAEPYMPPAQSPMRSSDLMGGKFILTSIECQEGYTSQATTLCLKDSISDFWRDSDALTLYVPRTGEEMEVQAVDERRVSVRRHPRWPSALVDGDTILAKRGRTVWAS